MAVALETAIAAVARDAGVFPERVRVRHQEVAAALKPRLAPRGVDVHGGGVPNLELAAREMIDRLERRDGDDRSRGGLGFYRTTPLAGKFLRFNL